MQPSEGKALFAFCHGAAHRQQQARQNETKQASNQSISKQASEKESKKARKQESKKGLVRYGYVQKRFEGRGWGRKREKLGQVLSEG